MSHTALLGNVGYRQKARTFPYYVAFVALALIAGQFLIDRSVVNIYCSVICGVSMALTLVYCFRPGIIDRFPVSTIAIVGFAVTNYIVALIAQTLDFKPIVFNLLSPRETFNATLEFQAIILLAHTIYRHTRPCLATSQWLAVNVLRPLWFFRVPKVSELWLLGMVGLGATWVSRILFADDVGFGNVGGKFLQALVPFIVTPLFIPFRGMFLGVKQRLSPVMTPALIAYFLVVVITAVAINARGVFAVVLLTIILATILMLAMGRLHFSRRARMLMIGVAIVAIPVTTIAQNLATAMQVARGVRGTGSVMDVVNETIRALNDPEQLSRWRADEASKTAAGGFSGVSEIYISNEFLQRLSYTKYTDLTMAASLRLADYQRNAVRETSRQQIISILPTPIITLFGFDLDKQNLSFSTGDLYADFAFGEQRGGFRTGSSITNTIDVLGTLWPAVVLVIYIVMFTLLDSYALRIGGQTLISTVFFIQFYEVFARGLVYESFRNLVDGISRAYVQALFVYCILALAARLAISAVKWLRSPSVKISST